MAPKSKQSESEKLTRIALVSDDKCKPKKCRQECKKSCPVVKMGKLCIEVNPNDKKAFLSEELCIGCGICVKKCPFEAISIFNLPTNLDSHVTHRYSANSFKLHRLPMPRPGQVLGLVGTNGIGKSTALKILAGKLKPNLGRYEDPPDWQEILKHFRGSELQNFFTKVLEDNIKAIVKPQYVDLIPRQIKKEGMTVGKMLHAKVEREGAGSVEGLGETLELTKLMEREVGQLSGGELQRFAIALACVQQADVYMFDEPSSYLDVRQRLAAARVIRGLLNHDLYVIAVEHDLSVLDYLSDFICCFYGMPSVYGVVTMPFSVREGINVFLDGYIPTENIRTRAEPLKFKQGESADDMIAPKTRDFSYPAMTKTLGGFKLEVEAGGFSDSEIVVLVGENGMGKTTFVQMLAGKHKPDNEKDADLLGFKVSLKPQTISPKFPGTVRMLLLKRIKGAFMDPTFNTEVIKPMQLEVLMDQEVQTLSGGELQRVAIVLSLGLPADIYLIDEPSAYLDSEQRITAAKIIKRFILSSRRTALIIEHDFIMATYLADKVIVYDGQPGIHAFARKPEGLVSGFNKFLNTLDITFRRDPTNYRPRINKLNSLMDREQKNAGNFFFVGDDTAKPIKPIKPVAKPTAEKTEKTEKAEKA